MAPTFTKKFIGIGLAAACLYLTSCGGEDAKDAENPGTDIGGQYEDTTDMIGTINGKIFSVPSPVQTAFLIKESNASYNDEILNPPENQATYASKFEKALNLGIYGADLGYVTIYDNTNEALSYLTAVQKLSSDLQVEGAFSGELIDRFSNNLGNKDTMLVLVTDAYKAGDQYLKENDRSEVAGLILAGGWIESLYFATLVAKEDKSPKVIKRIGEQKTSLVSLIDLLREFGGSDEEYEELIEELEDLKGMFDNIKQTYTFNPAESDDGKKLTSMKHTSDVEISDEDLSTISEKIESIRNEIVG
jgi:hypothetical protein